MEALIVGRAGILVLTSEERFSALCRFYVDTLGLRPDRIARIS